MDRWIEWIVKGRVTQVTVGHAEGEIEPAQVFRQAMHANGFDCRLMVADKLVMEEAIDGSDDTEFKIEPGMLAVIFEYSGGLFQPAHLESRIMTYERLK